MSKADELLKKAAFFEKLALYSDRKSFLQAIAQENPTAQLDLAISGFNQIVRQNSNILDPGVFGNLVDLIQGGQYPQALKLMGQVFTYRMPDSLRSQLDAKYTAAQRAWEKVSELAQLPTGPAQTTTQEETQEMGTGTGTRATEPAAVKANPAISAAQGQLNYILFGDPNNRVMPYPLKVDGILGDQTKKALELFKAHNPTAANLSGQPLFNEIKRIYDTTRMYEASRR